MIFRALQFDFPSAAWLLFLVIGIAVSFFYIYHYRKNKLQAFAEQSVLDAVVVKREPVIFCVKSFLYFVVWICGVFALMGPKGNEQYVSSLPNGHAATVKKNVLEKTLLRRNTHEVIFLIDASASMEVADVSGRTRLEVAKEIVDDAVRHLKGENVSLYAFTSATVQVVPSTLDYLFMRLMLQQIKINEDETEGTNIKQALDFLRQQYFAKVSPKTKTLIILSDGGDTRLEGLGLEERKQAIEEIISPVADAGEKNLHVFSVGLGSAQGKEVPGVLYHGHPINSSLEVPLLHKLSLIGKGELFIAGEKTPFQISRALNQNIAQEESFVDATVDLPPSDMGEEVNVYDFYFQYPLAMAIAALMGCLLIPDTRKEIGGRRL